MTHLSLSDQLFIAYQKSDRKFQAYVIEKESFDYEASTFLLIGQRIKFRKGKITPTKKGFFITFWQRIENYPISPYNFSDPFDFLIVEVLEDNNQGIFIFPKAILAEKGILSNPTKKGKLAFRLYPSWVITDSDQARQTQKWQSKYFHIKD